MFRPFSSIKVVLAATVLFHMSLRVSSLWANVFTWSGGGNDDAFDTALNWSGGIAPTPGTSTDLHFAGSVRLTPLNTFAASSDIGSIVFDSGAGAFNVGGNSVNLFGSIQNESTTAQTISLTSLSLTSTSAFRVNNGNLTISLTGSGENILSNGNTLNVYGSNNKTLTFAPGTVIGGSGDFELHEFNTVQFLSAQTYTGATRIDDGWLQVWGTIGNNTGAIFLGNSSPAYANTAAADLFIINSGLDMANEITVNKADTGTALGFAGHLIDGMFASGTSTLSGGIVLNGDLHISQTVGGTLKVTGVIRDGTDTGFTSHAVDIGASARKGVVVFTANNTYTGNTTVTAGTLELNNDGATNNGRIGGSSLINVARNTTLLFSGSGSVRDRVNNSGTLILSQGTTPNTGGYLNTGGLSEGIAPAGPGGVGAVVGMGALTLRANATIDFTSANGGSELVFQSFDFISGTVANIIHWTGTAGGDGSDRLLFATNPNLTTTDLQSVQFTNDAGANFATGGMIIDYNGYYELVPVAVPEPATWAAAVMTLLAVAVSQRRRLTLLRGSWR
jgi:autotransporter-associated beta strand protein